LLGGRRMTVASGLDLSLHLATKPSRGRNG
jgi:hypothetical protein